MVSQLPIYIQLQYCKYIYLCSTRLDQVLDFENDGVSKHLGQIADSMCEWEGPISEGLNLTPADIAGIKIKHPGELKLQT